MFFYSIRFYQYLGAAFVNVDDTSLLEASKWSVLDSSVSSYSVKVVSVFKWFKFWKSFEGGKKVYIGNQFLKEKENLKKMREFNKGIKWF